MPPAITITDTDIQYAESILLPGGGSFDEERRGFIRDLTTHDLQAVPGSGKTTALLAKLVTLEKYLPLDNGRGVLVISHTNAAVDEIKSRISCYCPKLFAYPNFIGTIQSFVDRFLAIPSYMKQFGKKQIRIDNEVYAEQVQRSYNYLDYKTRYYVDNQGDGLRFLNTIRLTSDFRLISYLYGTPEDFPLKDPQKHVYNKLLEFKIDLLDAGYLHYDDAYSLAHIHLDKIPHYPEMLQRRFQYVFVDEMQDMDTHQHELIDRIFYSANSLSVLQRIGDTNQAIYVGGKVKQDCIWLLRENYKTLNGSYRLNQRIASVVQTLALTPNQIEGRNKNSDGSDMNIEPTIILYRDETKEQVIETFAKRIKELQGDGLIPASCPNRVMAVAWIKQNDHEDRIALSDYWPNFTNETSGQRQEFKVLADYVLFYDKRSKTLESVQKNILNALLKILRLEEIEDNGRAYTKRALFNFLQSNEIAEYEVLKRNLYKWSIDCIRGKHSATLDAIRQYLNQFLAIFDKTVEHSTDFINGDTEVETVEEENDTKSNTLEYEGLSIEIGTVHSAKGQTHTATLYMETFYQKDGNGPNAKSYESQRLCEQLLGQQISAEAGKRAKQSAKVAYVGFSRPTHLLCIAVHKDRFDANLSQLDQTLWKIIEVEDGVEPTAVEAAP